MKMIVATITAVDTTATVVDITIIAADTAITVVGTPTVVDPSTIGENNNRKNHLILKCSKLCPVS